MKSLMEFKEFIGKIFSKIEVSKDKDEIIFIENNGKKYRMYHDQACCEHVYIEDICGKLDWLIGTPIISASEDTNRDTNPEGFEDEYQESFTWTFYNIATMKGYVTIRWYGESNGYYSESVDLEEIN